MTTTPFFVNTVNQVTLTIRLHPLTVGKLRRTVDDLNSLGLLDDTHPIAQDGTNMIVTIQDPSPEQIADIQAMAAHAKERDNA